jgi:cell division protein FtsB
MNFHHIRHLIKHYYTLDNIVLFAAILLAVGFIWSTMGALQNNYVLQRQVDILRSQVEASRLESDTLQLENTYFASDEYLELQARQQFGKASPGEHMIILPANTVSDTVTANANKPTDIASNSNFQAWLNFFFSNKNT